MRRIKVILIATTVLSLQASQGPDTKNISAAIAAGESGSPFANQIRLAIDTRQVKTDAQMARLDLAKTLAQNIEDVQSIRNARRLQTPLFSDDISAMDDQFNRVIQLILLCRNRLNILPSIFDDFGHQVVQPYQYTSSTGQTKRMRDDARDMQVYAFDLAARLRKLKKDLNSFPFDSVLIQQDYYAFQARVTTMIALATLANTKLSGHLKSTALDPMTEKVMKAQQAVEAVDNGEKTMEKAREDSALAGKFLGMGMQIIGQAVGTKLGKDGFIGMAVGEVAKEFTNSVASLISGPILEAKSRRIHADLKAEFGAYADFKSNELASLHYYMELGLRLFTDQWCTLWGQQMATLKTNSDSYSEALEKVVPNLAKKAEQSSSNTQSASITTNGKIKSFLKRNQRLMVGIGDSFFKINRRIKGLLSNLQTVQIISSEPSMRKATFSLPGQTAADYKTYITTQPYLTTITSLNNLLDRIPELTDFQDSLGALQLQFMNIVDSTQSPTLSSDEKESLSEPIQFIDDFLKSESADLRDKLSAAYPTIISSLNDPTLKIHDMALKEIEDANDAIVYAAPFITGGVDPQKGLLMTMSTDTLDKSTADQWALDMSRKYVDYRIIEVSDLSLLVQDAYSLNDDTMQNYELSMIAAYPKYARLAQNNQTTEELSMLLHDSYDLLLATSGPTVTFGTPAKLEDVAFTIINRPTEEALTQSKTLILAEFNTLYDLLGKFTADAKKTYSIPATEGETFRSSAPVNTNTKDTQTVRPINQLVSELLSSVQIV